MLFAGGGTAVAKTTDFVDLNAGLGYASNPGLRIPSQSSGFGRISAYGVHAIESEHGNTTFSAYVENTSYLRDYGSKQIFDLGAHTSQAVSEKVSIFGDLGFSGDFAGQLQGRLFDVPSQPPVPEPGNPLPPVTTISSADLFGLTGRQYRLRAQVGSSIRTSSKGTLSLAAGGQRVFFTGRNSPNDYSVYFGSVGYSQQVSERTSAGGTVSFQRQDFSGSDYSNVINPAATLTTQLSEHLSANASLGLLFIDRNRSGSHDQSVSPSFSGSICSTSIRSSLCARIARDAQSTLANGIADRAAGSAVSTIGSVDYYRQVGLGQTIQASINVSHFSSSAALNLPRFQSTFASAVIGYDRKVSRRLYGGIQATARKLFHDGPDPKLDLGASVYLRYRLGSLQ